MSKNIGKNVGKSLSSIYGQTLLDHAKQWAAYALKTVSKRAIQKKAGATCDLISVKVVDKITKV